MVEATPEFNDPKELVKSWVMFNMKKAGKFVEKNSKKIAAVAAVTGEVVAGTKSVKRKRKPLQRGKKGVRQEGEKLLQREKLHQEEKKEVRHQREKEKLHRGEERRQRVKLRSY